MATFDGKYLKGLVGNVVARKGNKIQIIQSAPEHVRQTEATKKAAGIFGQGSLLARIIRRNLNSLYNSNYHGEMINRFNTPVRAVLRQCYNPENGQFNFAEDSFSRLTGFEFNSKSLLINYLWVKPQVTYAANILTISIPEIKIPAQLKFPSRANFCQLKIAISKIALHESREHDPYHQEMEISKEQALIPAQEFSFEVPDGVFCVAGISLNYFSLYNNVKTVINSKTLHPAGIIGTIITPGIFSDPGPVHTATGGRSSEWRPIYNLGL